MKLIFFRCLFFYAGQYAETRNVSHILVLAKGSYGDVFPMYAIANELIRRGHHVLFATEQRHEHATKSIGLTPIILDAAAVEPSRNRLQQFFSSVVKKYSMSLWISAQSLRDELTILADKAIATDLVIVGQGALVGPLIATALKKKWVYCPISPLAMPSYDDPPLLPYVHWIQTRTSDYPRVQRLALRIAKAFSSVAMSSLSTLRRQIGLRVDLHPLFEGMYSSDLNLFLTSSTLIGQQNDWPACTQITGFTWFEPEFMRGPHKLQQLAEFLDAGPPPLIFALGGPSRTNPGDFFQQSINAAQLLGKRAIILTEKNIQHLLPAGSNFLAIGYVPYSVLIPRALAVVHSGGVGAIGWCLKFGIPSLLVPDSLDQFDNANRAFNNGFVGVLPRRRYVAKTVADKLNHLLGDEFIQSQIEYAKNLVETENGADAACNSIELLLIST